MLIFLQEFVLQIFLWLLAFIDGIMEIFTAISGVTDVSYQGEKVNIIEYLVGSTGVSSIFWCVFILSVGLSCIFVIVALVKNMIANNKNISSIFGKFFLSLLGTMVMLAVVLLGILIANALLRLVADIFQLENTPKLSNMLFNACVGKWLNGYSIYEIDVTSLSVRDIFGNYNDSAILGIWPKRWDLDGMVNPNTFLYVPSLIASIGVVIALLTSVLNLAKRAFEIVFMYLIMPISSSTLCLDDGARFKMWRETFITKIITAYGTVFSVNVFVLLLPMISKMRIEGISKMGNAIFLIFLIVGGAMLISEGQSMFARLFGQADDLRAGGSFLRTAFYGGRVATAMVIGGAIKIVKGVLGRKNEKVVQEKNDRDDSDKFTDKKEEDKTDIPKENSET